MVMVMVIVICTRSRRPARPTRQRWTSLCSTRHIAARVVGGAAVRGERRVSSGRNHGPPSAGPSPGHSLARRRGGQRTSRRAGGRCAALCCAVPPLFESARVGRARRRSHRSVRGGRGAAAPPRCCGKDLKLKRKCAPVGGSRALLEPCGGCVRVGACACVHVGMCVCVYGGGGSGCLPACRLCERCAHLASRSRAASGRRQPSCARACCVCRCSRSASC